MRTTRQGSVTYLSSHFTFFTRNILVFVSREVIRQALKNCMKKSLLFSFSLIGMIGLVTAVPLFILGLFGSILDQRWNTGRDFFVLSCAVSVVITYFLIRKIVKVASKKLEKIPAKSTKACCHFGLFAKFLLANSIFSAFKIFCNFLKSIFK